MTMNQARYGLAIVVGVMLFTVVGLAAEPGEIETFVKRTLPADARECCKPGYANPHVRDQG
ncbi:MAG: hypothetical protein HP494_04655 [Nitrospira sp.]|nr:hypothetical protein [Nitrospira sp.]